ncbi:MAG: hypothetical protein GX982_03300, partial [Tissierellia bacterium]|nr:hypothetical protein [Tissierellia bacterium]
KYSKLFLDAENEAKEKNLGFWSEIPSDNADKKISNTLVIDEKDETK